MTHIAVDMDDVLVDFVGGLTAAIETEYHVSITHEQLEDCGWNLRPLLDPIIGRNWWDWLRAREWLWARFPPVPGAIGAIDTLRRNGFYLELVTSKPEWAEHNVWKWLGHYRPAFNAVTIVDKHDRKVDFTKASVLIDDKPSNCDEFIEEGRHALLFSAPHNRHAKTDLTRVEGWPDVIQQIGDTYGW